MDVLKVIYTAIGEYLIDTPEGDIDNELLRDELAEVHEAIGDELGVGQ